MGLNKHEIGGNNYAAVEFLRAKRIGDYTQGGERALWSVVRTGGAPQTLHHKRL